ncbi:diguanylate cyclase [Candidatus Symbiopectobacterium sp. 'North America']|uniref:sensor domain-containing diguanylate cyclase n=1 Tax=Candidatus Symbiopectobacterium sp. 'North America' TaxID=2794574 RepID=UPI0018C97D02|nr:diguanylate cyclase [Candidatus Symbiopectobacterium sp. 'North America']MBG6245654.1 diguanylate cyclase [Candidatus Symbiopectobacterium sp. 'North America']
MKNDEEKPLGFDEVDVNHLFEFLHHNSDWVWEVDAQGRYTWASEVVTELLGFTPQEMIGKTPFDFMPPGEAERVGQTFGEIVAAKRPFSGLVNRNQRADGRIVVLETSGIPLFGPDGELRGYRGVDRNISTLGERVLQLETIYDTTPVALCMIDRAGRLVMSNKAMMRLLNHSDEPASELHVSTMMPDCWSQFETDFTLADKGWDIPSREVTCLDRCYYTQPVPVRDASENVVGLSVTWVDITRRSQAEQKLADANKVLQQYAQHHHLTGLFNLRKMDKCLIEEITRTLQKRIPLSVCLADIDFFKHYNDTFGHQAGDDCLRTVAKTLLSSRLRSDDNVSRYGGEEFLVILPHTDKAGAVTVAERLRENIHALRLPHSASATGYLTISIGVATLNSDQTSPEDRPLHMIASGLIHHADTALYAAKNQGRNRVVAAPDDDQRDAPRHPLIW